ncbi:hypothetical protein HPB51_015236 [Rhipicephalus microplus]|uniref:Tick transposon n=1 Tax=Rhipicephalus microplus TaxID=6941 RepID=A0A9J6DP57_RHIMP|nr:hypothetical protein HPB51_015236 [Rhipicephalus microplus]
MWNAHAGLFRRWQKQRYNKKLRHHIQTLSEEIERNNTYLARQQWGQLCNGLNEQLDNKKTWHLLRHLLDPDDSKRAARHRLKPLVHQHRVSDEDLLTDLVDKYINQAHQPVTPQPPYEGKPNPTLDANITEAVVYAAILKLRTTSAPGVGYKLRIEKEQKVFNSEAVLALVKKAVPEATIEEEKENEAIIALHTLEKRTFPAMFRELEDGSKMLGVKSTGVTVATMHDAYVK